jgi:hypothetical protein
MGYLPLFGLFPPDQILPENPSLLKAIPFLSNGKIDEKLIENK